MVSDIFIKLFFLFILILLNAFFAGSELAIISLNDQKLKRQAEEGDKKAQSLYKLTSEPSKFLANIQVGVTLAGLMSSAVASQSFANEFTQWLITFVPLDRSILNAVAVVVITICLSYFTLVFGELVPKRLAMRYPEPISRFSIAFLNIINLIAGPFVKLLSFSTNLILRLVGIDPNMDQEQITEEEIRLMVDVGQEKGVILSTEKEMIDNIFELDDTNVADIMTHRTEVIALPLEANWEEILQTIIGEKFSRIPIYEETIDNIVGILHVQDLIPYLKYEDREIRLEEIIRKPYFVPEFKKNNELLRELQLNKNHMAVIVDEYGGLAGIATIEDLLEEIVGNILDERDEEIKEYEKLDENTYLLKGSMELEKVNKLLGIQLPTEDFDTLSGFLIGELDRIPEVEEHPVIELDRVVFKVEEMEDRRIRKIKAAVS